MRDAGGNLTAKAMKALFSWLLQLKLAPDLGCWLLQH